MLTNKNFFEPLAVKKYIHCGNCWKVLGEIPSTDPTRYFGTFDCGWPCGCGRLNLSSDGLSQKYDSEGNIHFIYVRIDYNDKEDSLVEKLPNNFEFNKDAFKPELIGMIKAPNPQ